MVIWTSEIDLGSLPSQKQSLDILVFFVLRNRGCHFIYQNQLESFADQSLLVLKVMVTGILNGP